MGAKGDGETDNTELIQNILNKFKNSLKYDKECVQQNNIIQNMTKLINNKKDKLSQIQLQICSEL